MSHHLKMKSSSTWLLAALLGCASGTAWAQLQLLPGHPPGIWTMPVDELEKTFSSETTVATKPANR
jgi:hypothetical protein